MRKELNEVIGRVVDTRLAIDSLAYHVIQELQAGRVPTYREHKWGRPHFEAMERAHQGVEAAWHYLKWLQFPEVEFRLAEGSDALASAMGRPVEIFVENRLTSRGVSSSAAPAIEMKGGEEEMAKKQITVAKLADQLEELREIVDNHVTNLNEQIVGLEQQIVEIEGSGDRRKARGRQMTDEQRKAAGERLQTGRANKLGLDSIEQLRALKLRPGQKPTKAMINRVKKEHPVS